MSKEDCTWTGLTRQLPRRRFLERAAALGIGAAGLALVGCDDEGGHNFPIPTVTEQELAQDVLALWNKSHDIAFRYERRLKVSSQEEIRQSVKDLTIQKARLIEREYIGLGLYGEPPNARVENRDGRDIVLIRGQEFDVRHSSSDYFIGAALIDYLFEEKFADILKDVPGFESNRQILLPSNMEEILWLQSHLVDVQLGDVSPITRTRDLATLARALKVFEAVGLPRPNKLKLDKSLFEKGGNPHHKFKDPDTILLDATKSGGFDSARSIASFLATRKPNLVGDYLEVVSRAYKSQRQPIANGYFTPNGEEGFIKALEDYMFDGVSFRKKIAYAETWGRLEAGKVMLQVPYAFLKHALGNREFSINFKVKLIMEYKIGDTVMIDDYARPDKPGIVLRQRPTLKIDPGWPYVNDGTLVQIIGGSELVPDDEKDQATRMWLIRRHGLGVSEQPGWVSEEWFGPSLKLSDQFLI